MYRFMINEYCRFTVFKKVSIHRLVTWFVEFIYSTSVIGDLRTKDEENKIDIKISGESSSIPKM